MDRLIETLRLPAGQGDQLGHWEVLLALVLALCCLSIICLVYRQTHRSANYSQSYVQTLILTGLVTTLIMIVIGSNIARAFSLVGALSIIRFRNAVKETRDVGYIFFAMAIAMACGTRFYIVAVMATAVISSVMILLNLLDFGARPGADERILAVQLPPGHDPETVLQPVLGQLFESFSLIQVASARQGLHTEALYSVVPRDTVSANQVLDALALVNGNLKVTYNIAAHVDAL